MTVLVAGSSAMSLRALAGPGGHREGLAPVKGLRSLGFMILRVWGLGGSLLFRPPTGLFFRPRSPSRYFFSPRAFSIPRGFSDPPRAQFPSYSFDPNTPPPHRGQKNKERMSDGEWNREGLRHAAVRGDKLFCRPGVKSHRRLLQNKMKFMRCLGPRVHG